MNFKAIYVADYIVYYAISNNKRISHLQLQKILYFLEAFYLVYTDESLIEDDIFKWRLGPVFLDVYHKYKLFGSDDIFYIPTRYVFDDRILNVIHREFDPNDYGDMSDIHPFIDSLLKYSGIELVNETRSHDIWLEDKEKIYQGRYDIKYSKFLLKSYFINNPNKLNIMYEK